jgi:molybdenum cofactor cytidylyltransferase
MSAHLPGLVLAAGASSRMGQTKALLQIEPGGTFLGRILGTLADAGIAPLLVITRDRLDIGTAWADPRATRVVEVINPDPSRGQLSSLMCGVDALQADADGVLMALVDVPLVRVASVRALIDGWRMTKPPLARLTCGGRHGHPVIFGSALLEALQGADPSEGAKPLIRAFASRGIDIPVDDPGILVDVDTPDDYARLVTDCPR